MERYGHALPPSQMHKSTADTKLLIKLHSAAITIQQNYRRHLITKGFYDSESPSSQMYVDSEDDNINYQFNYNDMTSEKKQPTQPVPKQLIA